jgi:hypothetical protein
MKNNGNYNFLANHQELSRLLPWYVNKTLHGTELQAVENHLSVCLICKRELNNLQKLAHAVVQDSAMDSVEQAAFSRLKSRIRTGQGFELPVQLENNVGINQQQKPERTIISINAAPKLKNFNFSLPRPALALAAALLISLLIPRYVETELNQNANFRTLSSSKKELHTARANEIRVVFAATISPQQKSRLLESIEGQIIDAPTAQGVYTVRLERETDAKHLLEIVDLLRKDSSVVFAEPSYALLSSVHTESLR